MRPVPSIPLANTRLADFLRKLRQAVIERTPLRSNTMQLVQTPNGYIYRPIGRGGTNEEEDGGEGAEFKQFSIVSVRDDVLVCRPYNADGTIRSAEIKNVAKPWRLRRTFYDGRTIGGITYSYSGVQTRNASTEGSTELQTVVPVYGVGDILVAVSPVTGLAPGDTPFAGIPLVVGVPTIEGGRVEWLDINVDGRSWASPFG